MAALGADGEEPGGPAIEDARGMAEGLDVVHHGRKAEIAAIDREWRPRLRLARQPLAGTDQRALLAADIGPRAHLDAEVEIEARRPR